MQEKLDKLWKLMTEIHSELTQTHEQAVKHQNYVRQIQEMSKGDTATTDSSAGGSGGNKNSAQHRVTLNVGGKIFETQRSVLTCDRAKDSMLFAVGSGWFEDDSSREETFIDRDGTLFGAILSWLRDGSAQLTASTMLHTTTEGGIPSEKSRKLSEQDALECLQTEARYYGLDNLVADVAKKLQQCSLRTTCYLSGWAYDRLDLHRLRWRTNAGEWHIPISHLFTSGTKTDVTLHFIKSAQFGIKFFGREEGIDYSSSDLVLQWREVHVVTVALDWRVEVTGVVPTPVVEVDGQSWRPEDDESWDDWETGFAVLTVCSATPGSEICIHDIQQYPVEL
eukprot:TRINITY_DN67838_c9_g3_i4.p1 TRINITY_DN67838_c9_g3~~TRINITY_DN67838_c9_g3_i4.p1  ORF type:complete len:337 (+),score=12.26 TRINITY_DN67838_c9_g3_i4:64-1074(+)